MEVGKKLLKAWLRVPERGVDILSIVLVSSGINIMTSAVGVTAVGLTLMAGAAVTGAGIAGILLKYWAGTIRRSVDSQIRADIEAAREGVPTDAGSPKVKSDAAYLEEAISQFLDHSSEHKSLARELLCMTVLTFVGALIYSCVISSEHYHGVASQQQYAEIEKLLVSLKGEVAEVSSASQALGKLQEAREQHVLTTLVDAQATLLKELDDQTARFEGIVSQLRSDFGELTETLKGQEDQKEEAGDCATR